MKSNDVKNLKSIVMAHIFVVKASLAQISFISSPFTFVGPLGLSSKALSGVNTPLNCNTGP